MARRIHGNQCEDLPLFRPKFEKPITRAVQHGPRPAGGLSDLYDDDVVVLTLEERRKADDLAALWFRQDGKKEMLGTYSKTRSREALYGNGAAGEAAFTKWLVRWGLGKWSDWWTKGQAHHASGIPDVFPNYEVRQVYNKYDHLLIEDNDLDRYLAILVIGSGLKFRVAGWIPVPKGKQIGIYKGFHNPDKKSYWVRQEKLNPMRDLRAILEERKK